MLAGYLAHGWDIGAAYGDSSSDFETLGDAVDLKDDGDFVVAEVDLDHTPRRVEPGGLK